MPDLIRFYTTEQLSENMSMTPEGYLLCANVPLTRIGEFLYRANELMGKDGKSIVEASSDGVVRIQRDEGEVFSEIALKSAEGKPFTMNHPQGFVGPENWQLLSHGTVQNVRRGSNGQGDLMLGDILVTTEEAIKRIKDGEREISCGYDAEYEDLGGGIGRQKEIIFNHIALVSKGRAGGRCSIQDNHPCTGCGKCEGKCHINTNDSKNGEVDMNVKDMKDKFIKFFDGLAEETEEEKTARLKKEKEDKEAAEAKDKKTKDDDQYAGLDERLKKIEDMLAELLSEENATEDSEIEKNIALEIKDADETKKEAEEADKEQKKKEEEEAAKRKEEEKEKKEEEEKEKKEVEDAWPDFISHAEVLVPGMSLKKPTSRKTMDAIKVDVLEKATAGEDKDVVAPLFKGKDLKKMTTDSLDVAFFAASQIVATKRNSQIQTKDARQLAKEGKHQFADARTIAEINKANKAAYAKKVAEDK